MTRQKWLATMVAFLAASVPAISQDSNGKSKEGLLVFVRGGAFMIDKNHVAILVEPFTVDGAGKTTNASPRYYGVVSLEKDANGRYPYDLFGPLGTSSRFKPNTEFNMWRAGWSEWRENEIVAYDFKPDGKLVRWQHEKGDFRRSVLDIKQHAWTVPQVATVPKSGPKHSYPWRRYLVSNSKIYDCITDTWVDDPWADKIAKKVGQDIRGAYFFFTDDRTYVIVNAWGERQIEDLEEEREYQKVRRSIDPESKFGDLKFNHRTKLLLFHRDSEKPTVLDRFENDTHPEAAFVDRKGELLIWYEPAHSERGEIFSDIVLTSLQGKPLSRLEGANFRSPSFSPESVWFDRERSALVQPTCPGPFAHLEHHGTPVSSKLRVLTWKFQEDKKDTLDIDLSNLFEVRESEIVPSGKPAIAIAEQP